MRRAPVPGASGALLAGAILARLPPSQGLALCFLTFLLTGLSLVALAQTREPARTRSAPGVTYGRRLGAILSRDSNFRRFLLARAIGGLGGMATGLVSLHVGDPRAPGLAAASLPGTAPQTIAPPGAAPGGQGGTAQLGRKTA